MLHAQHANTPEIVDRMFQEAQTASAIAHPTIVNVIDCGRLPDGRPYIVMEYVPGLDLDEHVAQVGARWGHPGRITVEQATPLMLQLFDGLRAAHERGIVHRDLKTSNVRVTFDGPAGDAIKNTRLRDRQARRGCPCGRADRDAPGVRHAGLDCEEAG